MNQYKEIKKMKKQEFKILAALVAGGLFASCSDSDSDKKVPAGGGDAAASYVISATAGGANYLLTSETLDGGSVTVQKNGYETSTGTAWLFYKNDYLYRLQYNQSNAGVTSSYRLEDDSRIGQRPNEYNIARFTTYGVYGEHVILASAVNTDTKITAGGEDFIAKGLGVTYLHVTDETTSTRTINGENFLGNGEYVSLAGILDVNRKLYTAVIPMGLSRYGVKTDDGKWVKYPDLVKKAAGGSASSSYEAGELQWTQYPNEAWIAIYDNVEFKNPLLIRTDKISYACGRMKSQYYQTIWADDAGNVYVFSPGYARLMDDNRQKTTLPAGVVRIRKGEANFDPDYYFDIEAASGGQPLYRCWPIADDYFLLQMYTKGLNSRGTGATRLAIYKGEEKRFRYVEGLPAPEVIASFGGTPYRENGFVYLPVVTTDGSSPALYKIDPVTAVATKGLVVQAESVSIAGKLVSR